MVYVFIILTIISADLFTKKLIHDKLFVEEKKEIYVAIGKTNKNGIMMDMIYDTFKKEIIEGIDKSEQRVKIPSNFVATFYLGAVFSAGTEWLMSDFKYTKEEMLNYLNILIPDGLEIANKK